MYLSEVLDATFEQPPAEQREGDEEGPEDSQSKVKSEIDNAAAMAMAQWMIQNSASWIPQMPEPAPEHPVYVNPKQYRAIMRRRFKKARYEARRRIQRRRTSYLHESRHKHAKRRPRGPGGKFLSKPKKTEKPKKSKKKTSKQPKPSRSSAAHPPPPPPLPHTTERKEEGEEEEMCERVGITSAPLQLALGGIPPPPPFSLENSIQELQKRDDQLQGENKLIEGLEEEGDDGMDENQS